MSNSPYFDTFGNLKSIISKDRRCWFCGSSEGLEIHHAFSGCYRNKSTEDGLFVYVCRGCHDKLHFSSEGRAMSDKLRAFAQGKYEESHSREEFMKKYGRNWI